MTVVWRSRPSSTVSWRRAASSSQTMSFRFWRSASSPYSASGTSWTTAARSTSTMSRAPAGRSYGPSRTTPKTYSPRPPSRVTLGDGARTAAAWDSRASVIASASSERARSRASARACSTTSPTSAAASAATASRSSGSRTVHLPLQQLQAALEVAVLLDQLIPCLGGQRRVGLPPVDAHLAGPVDGRDQQPELDGQQLDVEQVDLNVPGDDDALVEHPLEDVGQAGSVRSGHRCLAGGKPALHAYTSSTEARA